MWLSKKEDNMSLSGTVAGNGIRKFLLLCVNSHPLD